MLATLVPHKVVAQLHLAAKAQIDTLHAAQGVEVYPKLRFGHDDEFAIDIGIIPHIAKAAERAEAFCKGDAPYLGELKAAERMGTIVAIFEIIFIECLHRKGFREVGTMPVPRTAEEHGMLKSIGLPRVFIACQAAIIFYMRSPLLVARDIKLACNLPIGACHAIALIVDVGEGEGASPFVGLKQLECGGERRAISEIFAERVA